MINSLKQVAEDGAVFIMQQVGVVFAAILVICLILLAVSMIKQALSAAHVYTENKDE